MTNYLDTFTYDDMLAALEHRIRVAGRKALLDVLDEGACKALYVASRGVPREIMKIANASLLLGALNEMKPLNDELIKAAVENILRTDNSNGAEHEALEL